jgi:hypothetical protein
MSQTKGLGPSVLHDFKVPKEKVNVTSSVTVRWANSGGTDNSGYKTIRQQESCSKLKKQRPLLYSNY